MRPALLMTRCHGTSSISLPRSAFKRPTDGARGLRMPQERGDLPVTGDLAAGDLPDDAIDALEEVGFHAGDCTISPGRWQPGPGSGCGSVASRPPAPSPWPPDPWSRNVPVAVPPPGGRVLAPREGSRGPGVRPPCQSWRTNV